MSIHTHPFRLQVPPPARHSRSRLILRAAPLSHSASNLRLPLKMLWFIYELINISLSRHFGYHLRPCIKVYILLLSKIVSVFFSGRLGFCDC